MGKQRRTRADKIRAAARHRQRIQHRAVPAAEPVRSERPAGLSMGRNHASPLMETAVLPHLKSSLVLFAVLIGLQLAGWLVFTMTSIDEALFELIRL